MHNKLLALIAALCLGVAAHAQLITLDSCLRAAKQHNCTIRTAQLDIQIAQELQRQVLWNFFPQASIEGQALKGVKPLVRVDMTDVSKTQESREFLTDLFHLVDSVSSGGISSKIELINWGVNLGVMAVQPVYWGGMIINGNKLAKLNVEAQKRFAEVSERELLEQVENVYWLITGLLDKRHTLDQGTALLDTAQAIAQTALDQGIVTQNDILRVDLERNKLQTNALKLKNGMALATRLLCQLTGIGYSPDLQFEQLQVDKELILPVSLEDITIDGRPETELLELSITAEQLFKKVTIGETLPHIAIGVTGGYSNFFNRHDWNVIGFAKLSIPLTQWGQTAHKIKEHNLKIKRAEIQRDDLTEKMLLQNEQAYDQLTECIQLLTQHESACRMAKSNYENALMQYQAGMCTITELLEAQTLYFLAQNDYTDACINYRSALRRFNDLNNRPN